MKYVCNVCNVPKTSNEFFRNSRNLRGFDHNCKRCETIRKTQSAWYKESHNQWAKINKHKVNARSAVARALRKNKLFKPKVCELCGNTVKLNAHHEDYNKPLVVIWLCTDCHYKHHHPEKSMV